MLRPWQLAIQLDQDSERAVYIQIADAIVKDIQSGRLKAGVALPGSRHMSQLLKVNRNTVVDALNVLIDEGWLISKERQGTFVADVASASVRDSVKTSRAAVEKAGGEGYLRTVVDDGHPDSRIAPIAALARAYRQLFNQKGRWQMMGYGCELGNIEFRQQIMQLLNQQRGMQVDHSQIVITRGSQMAMYLTAHCLVTAGDLVVVENPGYQAAVKAMEHAGAKVLPVSVDAEGLSVDELVVLLKKYKRRIKAVYVTPHHQYPTTVTLSLARRVAIVQLADEYGFTVIEDDYDNEFHFGYRPVLPLCSRPELRHWIYIGTMSKVVAPALRIGYLACSDVSLVEKIGALRKIIDVQGDNIMEGAVLALIKDGTIKRHIRKATGYYREKRDIVTALLEKHLKGKASFQVPDGGLAFWIVPNKVVDWVSLETKLRAKGIGIITPYHYCIGDVVNGLRLGYASLTTEQLEEGIAALGRLM